MHNTRIFCRVRCGFQRTIMWHQLDLINRLTHQIVHIITMILFEKGFVGWMQSIFEWCCWCVGNHHSPYLKTAKHLIKINLNVNDFGGDWWVVNGDWESGISVSSWNMFTGDQYEWEDSWYQKKFVYRSEDPALVRVSLLFLTHRFLPWPCLLINSDSRKLQKSAPYRAPGLC